MTHGGPHAAGDKLMPPLLGLAGPFLGLSGLFSFVAFQFSVLSVRP